LVRELCPSLCGFVCQGPAPSHTLTGGAFNALADATSVSINLTRTDMDEIKRKQIALTKASSWLVAEKGAILDMNKQAMEAVVSGVDAQQVTAYISDTVPPTLDAFDFFMDNQTVVLFFSETVHVSTLKLETLTFEAAKTGASPFTLTKASSSIYAVESDFAYVTSPSNIDGHTVHIRIGLTDMNGIKRIAALAQAATSTHVSFGGIAPLVKDMFDNAVVAQVTTPLLQVRTYTADTISPVMTRFSFDMSGVTARLSMWFSETVDPTTFNKKELVLQSGETSGAQYKLKDGTPSTAINSYMHIDLDKKDLDAIKLLPSLANSKNGTFLVFSDELVSDMATVANKIDAAPASGAFAVDKYFADTTSPVLETFYIDLSNETLSMTFSEPIKNTSLAIGKVTLRNQKCENQAVTITLDKGTLLSSDGLEIQFQLIDADLNVLKADTGLVTSKTNTYLSLGDTTVQDMALTPNGNAATKDCKAVGALVVAEDRVQPKLVSWGFRANEPSGDNSLDLEFSESIDANLFSIPDLVFTLSGQEGGSIGLSSSSSKVVSVSDPPTSMTVSIGSLDMNRIKMTDDVFRDQARSILKVTNLLVQDMNKQKLEGVGDVVAANFSGDTVKPRLMASSLDMTTNVLGLTFSESVRLSSLNLKALTFYGDSTKIALSTPTSAATGSEDGTAISITLNSNDVNRITLDPRIAISKDTSRFSICGALSQAPCNTPGSVELVKDMQGNSVVEISEQLHVVSDFKGDLTKPQLKSFDLDLSNEQLVLKFSEAVYSDSLKIKGIRLQENKQAFVSGVFAGPDYAYTLTGGTMISPSGPNVIVNLTTYDLDRIKRLSHLAISKATTFVTVNASTITDLSGNLVEEVADGSAKQVTTFTADTVPPRLQSFKISMDKNGPPLKIRLRFSETVNITTLDVTGIVLQYNESRDGQNWHRLTGGTVAPVPLPSPP